MKMICKDKMSKLLTAVIAGMILLHGAIELKADKPTYGAKQEQKKQSNKTVKKPRKFRLFSGTKPKRIQKNSRVQNQRPSRGKIQQIQHTANPNITKELELLYQQEGRSMPNEMYQKKHYLTPSEPQANSSGNQNSQQRYNQPQSRNKTRKPKRKSSFFKRLFTKKPRTRPRQQQGRPLNNQRPVQNRRRGVQQVAAQPRHINGTRVQQTQGRRNNRVNTQPVQRPQVNSVPTNPLPALPAPEDIVVTQKEVTIEIPQEKPVQKPLDEDTFFEVAEEVDGFEDESLEITDMPEENLVEDFEEEVGVAIVKKAEKVDKNISEKLNRGEFDNPFTEVSEEEADGELVETAEKPVKEESIPVSDESEESESPFSGLTLSPEETELEIEVPVESEEIVIDDVQEEKYDKALDISSEVEKIQIKPLDEKVIQSAKPIEIRKKATGFGDHCPVTLRNHRKLAQGDKQYQSRYQSVVYSFASFKAKVKFDENPHFYAPVEGGLDVTLLKKQKVKGSLDHAAWYQGRLYLFSSSDTKKMFTSDPEKFTKELF